jgi:serine/threonine-protein kinase
MRAIEKLPADRFQSAALLAEQLEELTEARTDLPGEKLVVQALVHAGLVTPADTSSASVPRIGKRASVRRAVAGLAVLGAVAVAGGITLQASAPREGRAAGSKPLELVPASPGVLRVLATPWAEVWVDGQRVDVTPFARGIPLPPGTHYVTLVHPNAPVEKRTVDIVAGETRTLDVVMAVPDLAPKDDAGGGVEPSAERDKR